MFISLESSSYHVFPHLIIPLDIAHFFLLFLDGLLLFAPQCEGEVKRDVVESVAYQILTAVLTMAREGPDFDAHVARPLAMSALGILESSELIANTQERTRLVREGRRGVSLGLMEAVLPILYFEGFHT